MEPLVQRRRGRGHGAAGVAMLVFMVAVVFGHAELRAW
jgi:hypothetical protein